MIKNDTPCFEGHACVWSDDLDDGPLTGYVRTISDLTLRLDVALPADVTPVVLFLPITHTSWSPCTAEEAEECQEENRTRVVFMGRLPNVEREPLVAASDHLMGLNSLLRPEQHALRDNLVISGPVTISGGGYTRINNPPSTEASGAGYVRNGMTFTSSTDWGKFMDDTPRQYTLSVDPAEALPVVMEIPTPPPGGGRWDTIFGYKVMTTLDHDGITFTFCPSLSTDWKADTFKLHPGTMNIRHLWGYEVYFYRSINGESISIKAQCRLPT